jgi:hypothetical protein
LHLSLSEDVLRVIGRGAPQLERVELFGRNDIYNTCLAAQLADAETMMCKALCGALAPMFP